MGYDVKALLEVSMQDFLNENLTDEEWGVWWEHTELEVNARAEAERKVFPSNNTGLPFKLMPYDDPPAIGEIVMVLNEAETDIPVGWHQASMYGGYGPDSSCSNWWSEPVCGRCGGNPVWLPIGSDLPDPEKVMQLLNDRYITIENMVKEAVPEFKGRKPDPYQEFYSHSTFIAEKAAKALNESFKFRREIDGEEENEKEEKK